jgi:hypothetical protein
MTEAEELIEDYRHTFSSEAGKRVLADICAECHVLRPLPVPLEHSEGQRNAALSLLTKIRGDDHGGIAVLAELLTITERKET